MAAANKWHFEQLSKASGYRIIAGVDEAGRGPIAGPLVVAACILPSQEEISFSIDDSKKLSPRQREIAYHELISHPGVVYAIEILSEALIDEMNILQATMIGMQRVIQKLSLVPDHVLVDGNRSPVFTMSSTAIIQGDSLSCSIGAASILAKVTRDALMTEYDVSWPMYGFSKHKGYPTSQHLQALDIYGPCPLHRRSYAPVKKRIAL